MKKYRVDSKQLKVGTKHEMEHTNSEQSARRIARQHLIHHPSYYQVLPVAEKMMQARERNIRPIRKPRPRPQSVTGFSGKLL
jgi:hypothetical protein